MILIIFLLLLCGAALGEGGILAFILIIVGYFIFSINKSSNNEKTREEKHQIYLNKKTDLFITTKAIYRKFSDFAIYIDEIHKKIMIAKLLYPEKEDILYFDEIIECSILQDGATIVESNGAEGAVLGGIIGGGIGAIIGGTSVDSTPTSLSLSVRIITNNIQSSLQEIPIITSSTSRTSDEYKERVQFAQEIYATITSVMHAAKSE